MMAARRWASIVVGLFLLLLGTIFALQGANVIKGSAVMSGKSGNSTYIYVGGFLAVIGLVLIIVAATSKARAAPTSTREGTPPPKAIS
jgi:hypothetical protein